MANRSGNTTVSFLVYGLEAACSLTALHVQKRALAGGVPRTEY